MTLCVEVTSAIVLTRSAFAVLVRWRWQCWEREKKMAVVFGEDDVVEAVV